MIPSSRGSEGYGSESGKRTLCCPREADWDLGIERLAAAARQIDARARAVLWLAQSGARWRDLPQDRFGPYQTVKRRYYR